ncbi:glycoprotein 3-alpha-L-fucosyltransferase A-like [Babylonia areolata]|uniref:glycoprotein 3-alpha-L-fucosyltransferase A-like n=1 Tax=Babylonia areolata TaxID=304850 RepID=UPI003FD251E4
MRLNTKKLLQLLLAVFLVCVIYLNLNITDINTESRQANSALPWGDNFNQGKRPSLTFVGKKIHDHVHATRGPPNVTTRPVGKPAAIGDAPDHPVPELKFEPGELMYPSAHHYWDDRITKQLKFVSENIRQQEKGGGKVKVKKILVHAGTSSWRIPRGEVLFREQQCTVQACELVDDRSRMKEADVVLFQSSPPHMPDRPRDQIWAMYLLESPYHSTSLSNSRNVFNWTATYRHDSTIVAPYEKYIPLNESLVRRDKPLRNYAHGKAKKVAWFVSNCGARNRRRQYAEELSRYIQVDIYGACGSLKCPRFQSDKCFGMLNTDYKFYLAFENSNCRDYISEKFFINGLKHDVIPIVMGAAPEDYRRAAPPHSFIHVDDFESPKELAEYLQKLDADDNLYNEYFLWKGLWDNINTFFWCRMCAMAHDVSQRGFYHYQDVEKWWRGPEVCIGQDNWRQRPRKDPLIGDLPV